MVRAHDASEARTVTTLGFAVAIGLPLIVLALAVALPEDRN